jgi:hypothetical protein
MRGILILGMLVVAMMVMPGVAAKNTDPCNGFWYYERDVGPTTVYTNGSAGCTGGDVFLPTLRDCRGDTEYQRVETIRTVTIWQETCA